MDNQIIADVNSESPNGQSCQKKVYITDINPEDLIGQIQQNDIRAYSCTYEKQKILAAKIIQRIRLMLKHHQDKQLEDFKDFDFQVYTSRNNTLKEQTRSRLANRASGCIPLKYYDSASDIHKYTETRVHLYQDTSKEKKRHEDLLKDAEDNLDKLFLIIADEAHWGITGSGDGRTKAHDKLINSWDANKYKNVIVLLVTATAYNLLTEETRLPLDDFCAESLETGELVVVKNRRDGNVKRLVNESGKDITNVVGPKKPLHHVQWTETYSARLERGLKMTIRSLVTSSASGFSRPIYLGPQQAGNSEIVPFVGTESLEGDLTLIVKGKNNTVQLFDAYERQLVVSRCKDGDSYTVGFTSTNASDCNFIVACDFEMAMTFGEDVFSLYPLMAASLNCKERLSLYFDKTAKTVKVHAKPRAVVLGNHEVLIDLPVTDLFFIETLKDMDSPGDNSYRYLSLNFYYNTIWKQKKQHRKIRYDESFEELCQTMLQEFGTRKNVHNQTDVFVSEYCIFILALSEFDKLLSSNDATHLSVKDMMEEIKQATLKIRQKLDLFRKELKDQKYVFDENFIPEEAIGDVLAFHQSSIDDSFKDCRGFWKSTLKSCLFGHVEGISKRMGKVSDYSDVEIKDIRNLKYIIINSLETGKIISDVMEMTLIEGRLQGYMKVIRVNEVNIASKFYMSLVKARDIAYDDTPYLFEILRDYGNAKLQNIYQNQSCEQNYTLHLLLQKQQCANNDRRVLCPCEEYASEGSNVRCVNCGHHHNPVAKFEDLEGLPCIVILVDKGKMGDTFPPTFNCMDLRIHCPDRKVTGGKDKATYVLSSMVQEFGRLCRYNKADDHHNVPYVLVPKNMIQHLQNETAIRVYEDGSGTIYSGFLRGCGKIDRYTTTDKRLLCMKKNDGADNYDIKIGFNAANASFDAKNRKQSKDGGPSAKRKKGNYASPNNIVATGGNYDIRDITNGENGEAHTSGNSNKSSNNAPIPSESAILNKKSNMILLDAEPQCGKTGTYCCVIAELRKFICKEVSHDEIESESESSDNEEDDPVQRKVLGLSFDDEEEAKWRYPYHVQMTREKMNPRVTPKNKYARLHGVWRPGRVPDKRPTLPEWADYPQPDYKTGATTCQAPYKSEIHTHECHECSACMDQEQPRQTTVEVDLKDSGYQGKLFLYNPNRGPQLVASLRCANVECTPEIPQTSAERTQKQTDLKTWIFIPTSNRALSACLNLKHTMKGPRAPDDKTEVFKTYTQILVVKEEEFDQYCRIWGPKVTAILQLPSKMKDDTGKDVSATDGGVGFSRRFIQIFAQQLNLDIIFMLDDNVWFVQEIQFKGGKVPRLEGKASFECVPLYKVLSHMESLFDVNTPTPETSFQPYQDEGSSLSNLEIYTGPHSQYALLGVLKARLGSQKVKNAFKKRSVSSLLLVNLNAVTEKNIRFELWEAFEDLDFAEKANANNLWVCKCNRFLLFMKRVQRLPKVYLWDDDTKLTDEVRPVAENEVKFLKNWIEHYISPKEKRRIGNVNNERLQELFGKLKMKRHGRNVYFLCMYEPLQNAPEEALYKVLEIIMTEMAQKGICQFCITITVATCLRFSLRKVADFKRLFAKILEEGYELRVVSSHSLTEFQVEIITILVLGEVKGTSANDDMEAEMKEAYPEESQVLEAVSMIDNDAARLENRDSRYPELTPDLISMYSSDDDDLDKPENIELSQESLSPSLLGNQSPLAQATSMNDNNETQVENYYNRYPEPAELIQFSDGDHDLDKPDDNEPTQSFSPSLLENQSPLAQGNYDTRYREPPDLIEIYSSDDDDSDKTENIELKIESTSPSLLGSQSPLAQAVSMNDNNEMQVENFGSRYPEQMESTGFSLGDDDNMDKPEGTKLKRESLSPSLLGNQSPLAHATSMNDKKQTQEENYYSRYPESAELIQFSSSDVDDHDLDKPDETELTQPFSPSLLGNQSPLAQAVSMNDKNEMQENYDTRYPEQPVLIEISSDDDDDDLDKSENIELKMESTSSLLREQYPGSRAKLMEFSIRYDEDLDEPENIESTSPSLLGNQSSMVPAVVMNDNKRTQKEFTSSDDDDDSDLPEFNLD